MYITHIRATVKAPLLLHHRAETRKFSFSFKRPARCIVTAKNLDCFSPRCPSPKRLDSSGMLEFCSPHEALLQPVGRLDDSI